MPLETLRDLWLRNARLRPDAPAVVFSGQAHSYADVVGRARRLASSLAALGAGSQDRVCLLARNRAEWFDYFAACEMHGFIASTLNFRLSAPELAYIVDDARPKVLIFEDDYVALIEQLRPLLKSEPVYVCIGERPDWALAWTDVLSDGDPAGPALLPQPRDGVRLIYTSGTTGRPKGVLRSQAADLALARICATTSDMGEAARELIMMPMFHVGGQSMASGAHWVGGSVHLHRDFDPDAILRSIAQDRIEIVHLTPTILHSLIERPGIAAMDLSSLRTVCYAGAAMPVSLLQRGLETFGPVFSNCYGSTESGAAIVLQKPYHVLDGSDEALSRLGSLGQEHVDSAVRILDEAGGECAPGAVGEIALQTPGMMTGYWNNSSATVEALRDGWLRTGDLGFMDARGFTHLVDRKADMVISGGENIYSREVEDALLRHPDVRAAAVIGVPDPFWGEAVLAAVEPVAGRTPAAADLIAHCQRLIARYKAPKRVEFVDRLPLLPSAKVDKPSLRRTFAATTSSVLEPA